MCLCLRWWGVMYSWKLMSDVSLSVVSPATVLLVVGVFFLGRRGTRSWLLLTLTPADLNTHSTEICAAEGKKKTPLPLPVFSFSFIQLSSEFVAMLGNVARNKIRLRCASSWVEAFKKVWTWTKSAENTSIRHRTESLKTSLILSKLKSVSKRSWWTDISQACFGYRENGISF